MRVIFLALLGMSVIKVATGEELDTSASPSTSFAPTPSPSPRPSSACVYMKPNPFIFGPPVPSFQNKNRWPQDYPFWSADNSADGVPWFVNRSSPQNYFLQSPNYNGAQNDRQSNATLHVCGCHDGHGLYGGNNNVFRGGDLVIFFEATLSEAQGQLFQVVVDGQVATNGNITSTQTTTRFVVPLPPGNHWVEFVYTWTAKLTGLPTTSGIVKIFNVTLPQKIVTFPTVTPTDRPSSAPVTFKPTVSPTISPTISPTTSPTLSPTLSPTTSPTLSPTISPTVSPTLDPTTSPTNYPTLSPTTEEPTGTPTVAPTLNPTTEQPTMNPTTPEPTRVAQLPTTRRPSTDDEITDRPTNDDEITNRPTNDDEFTDKPDGGGWSPPHGRPDGGGDWSPSHGRPDGSWSPPYGSPHGRPNGGWSSSHDDRPDGWKSHGPIAWKNDSWGGKGGKGWSKSAKAKTAKSYSRPVRWIPESGSDWLSYGWDTTGWGTDDFSWGGKWGRNDSTSEDRFKWDRPMYGKSKTSKSKSSKKKGGSWGSDVSMSYSNDESNDWWKPPTSSNHSLPGGVWVDPTWQVSKGSDSSSSSSSSSQNHQTSNKLGVSSSKSSGGHKSSSSSKSISNKSQNGHHTGQSAGEGHGKKSSSGKGSDQVSHNYSSTESTQSTKSSKPNYSSTESTQSTKSSKGATRQIDKAPPSPSNGDSEEISLEDYNKMKYWAEKKWQNKKQSAKSGSDRVCPTSRLLLLTSTIAMPILLGFTFW